MTDKPRTALHETARRYATAGIPVFACAVNSKVPRAGSRGFKDATTDLDEIDRLWGEADYNIGVEPERAGWCVVDLDLKADGPAAWATLPDDKPATRTVATPGGGRHLYYAGSLPPSASKIAPGIDIRGRGSYVLIPPSVVDGRAYVLIDDRDDLAPLPAWIAERAGQQRERATAPADITLDTEAAIERARGYLAGALERQGPWGEEDPPDTYAIAAIVKDAGISPAMTVELMMGPLAESERDWLTRCVDNAYRYGQNAPGAYGGSDGIPPAWQSYCADAISSETLSFPLFRPWATLRDQVFAPQSWVWRHRLLAGEPNLYTGDLGAGKTTLAENLAVAVATGSPLLGEVTQAMPVAMLVAEDHYGPVRDNIAAIAQAFGLGEHDGLGQVHVLSVKSDRVVGGHLLARIDDAGRIEETAFLRECVVPMLQSLGPCLFVMDPLEELVAFNRLSDHSCRAGLVTGLLGSLCAALHTTILVNDHPSKAGMAAGHHYAGSVQFASAFPFFATLLKGEWTGTVAKQRKQTFQVMRGRYAMEETVDFYRTSSPAFTLQGLPGQSVDDYAMRVYRHVVERLEQGLRTGRDNRHEYGPAKIGHEIGIDGRDVERALSVCRGKGWLAYEGKTTASQAGWVAGHVTPLPGASEPEY